MSDAPAVFDATLRRVLPGLSVTIHDQHVSRLHAHFEAMVATNRTMNLTRVTDPAQAAVRHYADSLALLAWARDRNVAVGSVLDVGTGAGFPAVPLAVMRPDWPVTAIDGTGKKIDFVRRVSATIGLANLRAIHAHSSQWRTSERFDLVTFRALAVLTRAIERTAPFVAPRGRLVAYRTERDDPAEFEAAVALASEAGLSLDETYPYELPSDSDDLRGNGNADAGAEETTTDAATNTSISRSATLSRRLVVFRRSG